MIPREAFHEDLPRHRLGTPDSGGLSSALNGPGRFAGPGDGGWHADHGGGDRAGAPAPALRPGSGEVSPDPTEAGPDDRRAAARGGGGRTRPDRVGLRRRRGPGPDRGEPASRDRRARWHRPPPAAPD